MDIRSVLESVVIVCVIAVAGSLILGSFLGYPILLSYVETDSMSPMIDPGQGFVAVPTAVDDSVEVGDVVVYRAEQIQGGGLTTHRVVGETEAGFVTKGDGNSFTDQSGGEPPVKRAQVVATAMQVDGTVLVVPLVGTTVEAVRTSLSFVQQQLAWAFDSRALLGVQGIAYLVFAGSVVWYVLGALRARGARDRPRDTDRFAGWDVRIVVASFAILLVAGASAPTVLGSGTHEYEIVSAEFESERPDVIETGAAKTHPYRIDNKGLLPTFVVVRPASDGVDVHPRDVIVGPRESVNASLTLHAPMETGPHRRYVTEHRYLAVLPPLVFHELYGVHPWAPLFVADGALAGTFYLSSIALLGRARIRSRSRETGQSVIARVQGVITSLY